MAKVQRVDLNSKNFTEEFKTALKQKFPQVFNEDKIDCDKLKQALGEVVDTGRERFGMNWPGKANAIRVAQEPSAATLKPDRDSSVDFDSTENLYLEGDNLEILKLLQRSYFGKIKMIYIDPPYNTGKEFIYPDKYAEGLETYLQYTGQIDAQGKKFTTNVETDGRYHSKWMNMMWPRLMLSRNLLTNDGAIFISIGDNEADNLKKICNEIFGEENFIGQICRITKKGGNKGDYIKPKKDYVLFYFKNVNEVKEYGFLKDAGKVEWLEEEFDGKKRKYVKGDIPYREKLEVRSNQRYYIEAPDGTLIIPKGNAFPEIKKKAEQVKPISQADKCWTWSKDRYLTEIQNNRFIFIKSKQSPFLDENGNQSKWTVYKKVFYDEYIKGREILTDLIDDCENSLGTKELGNLGVPFDYPKPSKLIYKLSKAVAFNDDIVLDFFSGSATTAHAVMQLNIEDGGSRKFIMTQLPESVDETSEAGKAGYKNICEIGKERIRRAAKKIQLDHKDKIVERGIKIDFGFKVYRLDTSNFNAWDGRNSENFQQKLLNHVDHIAPGSKEEDLLSEILLKSGYELATKVETLDFDKRKVYSVASGDMMICLERNIDKELMKKIADKHPQKVVCLNSGFKTDADLTNAAQILKTKEIEFRTA
jgi:adenine-specific DNA-methyltransferase